jgi:peptidoglycan/LPS O-acetylase OafA/YrhL
MGALSRVGAASSNAGNPRHYAIIASMSPHQEAPAPDESTTGRHIPALDGLRGVAILLVLACHLLASNPYPGGNPLVRMFARMHGDGWIGVDLFFVLSGFLITGILYDTLSDPHFFRNFYARRTLRIFPLYYGFLLLLSIIMLFTGNHWYVGIWHLLTYTVSLPFNGPWLTDARWMNLNHVWSLAIEEQFYLVWPLLIYLLRTRRRIALAAIAGIIFSVAVRFFWVHFTNMETHPYIVYSWTPSRLDGLLSGALLALAVRGRFRQLALKLAPPVLALGCLLMAAIFIRNGSLEWRGYPFISVVEPLLLAVTFGALLLCCLRPETTLQRVAGHPVLRFFGRYSYGLYLFHYTLATALLNPLRIALVAHHHSKLLALILPAVLTLALSIAAAWLSFRYFESPFLRLKGRFSAHSHRPRLDKRVAALTPEPAAPHPSPSPPA